MKLLISGVHLRFLLLDYVKEYFSTRDMIIKIKHRPRVMIKTFKKDKCTYTELLSLFRHATSKVQGT